MTQQHPKSEFDLDRFEELAHNFIAIHLPDLSMNKHEEVCEGIGALAGDCCISIPARNDSDVLSPINCPICGAQVFRYFWCIDSDCGWNSRKEEKQLRQQQEQP